MDGSLSLNVPAGGQPAGRLAGSFIGRLFGRLRARDARDARDARAYAQAGAPEALAPAIAASVRLDMEIGHKLDEAVQRTEASALAIMQQVRALCDGSAALAVRLQEATAQAGTFEDDIGANVAALSRMSQFLGCLPARLQHDLDSIGQIAGEIKGLSGLAESVQTISMQSHLLSINAAIEASRAGASGQAFKVVAEEVRALAANSHGAAARIGGSLTRIRAILKDGLEQNAAKLSCDLEHIAQTAQAVTQLQSSFDRMSGTYQAQCADMLAQGEVLAAGSAEVLGQLQYQDVVRQCVERLQEAVAQRNRTLQEGLSQQPALLAALLGDVVEAYLAQEAMHGQQPGEAGNTAAIELF
jgi:methyl-accepting chemotaxis protein